MSLHRLVAIVALSSFPASSFNIQNGKWYHRVPAAQMISKTPIDLAFDTLMRFDLKRDLLVAADEFKELQKDMFAAKATEKSKKKRRQDERLGGLFGASSLAAIEVDLGDKGLEVIDLAERLSEFNPTEIPNYGWKGYGNGSPSECPLDGIWKLRFTTGKDATFAESPIRGKATTSQVVNASDGTMINTVDFEKGKVTGFQVVVEGTATSNDEMNLFFKQIIIRRKSRFPKAFGKITILLPSFKFLSAIAKFGSRGRSQSKGAGFQIRYIDNDMRMHKTRDGIWFIQTRIQNEN